MHHNYYFLRSLAAELNHALQSAILVETFSQNKNEIILCLEKAGKEHYIRLLMESYFSGINYSHNVQRAKRNTINLFADFNGLKVIKIAAVDFDRSILFEMENEQVFQIQFYGKRCNMVAYQSKKLIGSFKQKASPPEFLELQAYKETPTLNANAWISGHHNVNFLTTQLGKSGVKQLISEGFEEKNKQDQWHSIANMLDTINHPESFYLHSVQDLPQLSLIEPSGAFELYKSAIECSNALFFSYLKNYNLNKKKTALRSTLSRNKKKARNYITKSKQKLEELKNRDFEKLANIIMANLHTIKIGTQKVTLFDFYEECTIDIKLKANLSPQKNAEQYYKKAKNQKKEEQILLKNIKGKQQQLEDIEKMLLEIDNTDTFKILKNSEKAIGKQQKEKESRLTAPYYDFLIDGFKVWVGKNARANDELTLKHAKKDDLWLHAKDVAGSHVVIKAQAGKPTPALVIEKAASLAAYYSKRKSDTLCPVSYTLKKYVRKRKGAHFGEVIVERETVIMVAPENNF